MIFPLEIWIDILKHADALTTARIAQSCKELYELIRVYVDNKGLNPSPTLMMRLDIYKTHGWLEIPKITKVCLPIDYCICVCKDTSKIEGCLQKSMFKRHIDLTFPDLRSPNTKLAFRFRLLNESEVGYICFTSKLNVELHYDGVDEWWMGTKRTMQTPRVKDIYKIDVGYWYFYFPIGKRKSSQGYKLKVSREMFTLSALQALSSNFLITTS